MGLRTMLQCDRIATALLESQLEPQNLPTRHVGVSLCVEGNISAGKSTFLRFMEEELNKRSQEREQGGQAFDPVEVTLAC